ncbi:MAG: copper resistance protein NlpE N-terminal domain-containing protein [Bacteroidales bacterium]|jgi:heat shock protein HslJ|nr:copper resistance protein NlpE N-terminal domain-containing protein [Bacteroidales bacterium]
MKVKDFIGLALVSILVFGACQSKEKKQNLDAKTLKGVYVGVMPCADCEGISTALKLNEDMTYLLQTTYQGKGIEIFQEFGKYTIDGKKREITLENITDRPSKYLYENHNLVQLDMNGKKISGVLALNYILLKKEFDGISNRRWKLTELSGKAITDNKAFITIDTKEGRAFGNGGCNNFTAAYELDEATGRLRFSKIATTQMACIDMETETAFLEILENIDNYSMNGEKMTLNKAKMAPLAVFEAVYVE